jgi:hypothetical protein
LEKWVNFLAAEIILEAAIGSAMVGSSSWVIAGMWWDMGEQDG